MIEPFSEASFLFGVPSKKKKKNLKNEKEIKYLPKISFALKQVAL
jgi:hypothetical protein